MGQGEDRPRHLRADHHQLAHRTHAEGIRRVPAAAAGQALRPLRRSRERSHRRRRQAALALSAEQRARSGHSHRPQGRRQRHRRSERAVPHRAALALHDHAGTRRRRRRPRRRTSSRSCRRSKDDAPLPVGDGVDRRRRRDDPAVRGDRERERAAPRADDLVQDQRPRRRRRRSCSRCRTAYASWTVSAASRTASTAGRRVGGAPL